MQEGVDRASAKAVQVVEVGPRDGLQNESTLLSTQVKVEFVRRAVAAGARRIEAVSFVNPRLVPQMADGEAVMAELNDTGFARVQDHIGATPVRRDEVILAALVLNERGLERALAAGVDEINMVVAASDGFAHRNQNASVAKLLTAAATVAELARQANVAASVVVSTAFGCPFDGEVASSTVLDVVRALVDAGYREVALADTIGVGVPAQVRALFTAAAALPGVAPTSAQAGVRWRAHFHNTRNTGYANALAALESGVSVLDASIGGIGGCPFAPNATGNIATEDLQYLLQRSGYTTGLTLEALAETGSWIGDELGKQAPALLGRAGAFPASRAIPPR